MARQTAKKPVEQPAEGSVAQLVDAFNGKLDVEGDNSAALFFIIDAAAKVAGVYNTPAFEDYLSGRVKPVNPKAGWASGEREEKIDGARDTLYRKLVKTLEANMEVAYERGSGYAWITAVDAMHKLGGVNCNDSSERKMDLCNRMMDSRQTPSGSILAFLDVARTITSKHRYKTQLDQFSTEAIDHLAELLSRKPKRDPASVREPSTIETNISRINEVRELYGLGAYTPHL